MARGKGDGSFRERDDGRWEGRVVVNGARRSFYGSSRNEVRDLIRKAIEASEAGLIEGEKITVAQYLNRWLENFIKPRKAENTYASYRYTVGLITPIIGHVPLRKLLPAHVTDMMGTLKNDERSEWIQRYAVVILRTAVRRAVKDKVIPVNHLQEFEVPAQNSPEKQFWNEEDVVKFFSQTAKMDSALYPLFFTAAMCGLRHGELLALRWEDIDLQTGKLAVRRTLLRSGAFTEPKTKSAKRTLTVPPAVIKALRALRAKRLEQGLATSLTDGLVFCTRNGTPYLQSNVRKAFYRAISESGLKRIKIHDLRHTCATLLLKMNVHPKIVQARLGHSKVSITMDTYSHALPSLDEAAAEKLDEVFKGTGR